MSPSLRRPNRPNINARLNVSSGQRINGPITPTKSCEEPQDYSKEPQDIYQDGSHTTASGGSPRGYDSDDDRCFCTHDEFVQKRGQRVNNAPYNSRMQPTMQEDLPPPPPPPPLSPPVTRTKLTSLKTKLQSGAALFIPKGPQADAFAPQGFTPKATQGFTPKATQGFTPKAMQGYTAAAPPGYLAAPPQGYTTAAAAPWTPTDGRPCGGEMPGQGSEGNLAPGKTCIKETIQAALGSELWDLSMVDCQGFNGDWYTNVDVVVPALSASKCHLATSGDSAALAAAHQAAQSGALQCVLDSLQSLAPKVTAVRSEDAPQLSVQYCGADPDMLCWEFTNKGNCPRGSTCRWAHPIMETFIINMLLRPLTNWGASNEPPMTFPLQPSAPIVFAALRAQQNIGTNNNSGQVLRQPQPINNQMGPRAKQPKGPAQIPIPPRQSSALPGLPLTKMTPDQKNVLAMDPDDTPWPDHIQEQSFNMKSVSNDKPKKDSPTLRSANPSRRMWADIQEDSDDEPFFLSQWSSTSPTSSTPQSSSTPRGEEYQ